MSASLTVDPGIRKLSTEYLSEERRGPPLCVRISKTQDHTDESPAVVEISFRNCIDQTITVMFGISPPLDEIDGRNDADETLMLLPTDDIRRHLLETGEMREPYDWDQYRPQSPTDGVWKATGPSVILDGGTCIQLTPGETIRNRYQVLAGPEASSPPEGDFRFKESYPVGLGPELYIGEHYVTVGLELRILTSNRVS